MDGTTRRGMGGGWRALSWLDARVNALTGWRGNPLYQSGSMAVAMLVVLLLTGVYLVFFYRLGGPYASVERLQEQVFLGRWIRALHRYAGDVAVVAIVVHGLRMFLERRTWGARMLAWVSGGILVWVFLICGWTGFVMVWDTQGQLLAREGARLLDVLPLFASPIERTFVGERPLPSAFFFLNLFAHVAIPVGLLLVLWLHVSRLARPVLLPPRRLLWTMLALLLVISVAVPAPLGPEGDALRVPASIPIDVFYAFWLPLAARTSAGITLAAFALGTLVLVLVPLWSRPGAARRPPASVVDERLCTGCEQCYEDCPYEAIRMVQRTDGRATPVARVDAGLCVSCGICAGSCAPMGVGPSGRTGRDQLEAVRTFIREEGVAAGGPVVVVACRQSAITGASCDGAPVFSVSCAGNLHTSVVEYLVRAGAAGVLIVSCPPRDCWSREGPRWLVERIAGVREAELKERVDRARVRIVYIASHEVRALRAALREFRASLESLRIEAEAGIELDTECERPGMEVLP